MNHKKIIISIILLAMPVLFIALILPKTQITSQSFSVSEKEIVLELTRNSFDINKGEYIYDLIDTSYLNLTSKKNEKDTLNISYEFQNEGDDTPEIVGDTGAGLWPPQPEELLYELDEDNLILLGEYLGKNLYISKVDKDEGRFAVYQKIGDKFTSHLAILNQDQNRPNYNASLSIRGTTDVESNNQQKSYREFIKILKSMEITSLEKPE